MFSRKNTVIIALIAIFALGSVVLQASITIEVSNVYSNAWSHEAVEVHLEGGYWWWSDNFDSGPLYNVPPTYVFYGVFLPVQNALYEYTINQGSRTVSGTFYYHGQWGFSVTLPGHYEPRPNDPPMQD